MSLGIVIKGPEGLVLAAESRLTLTAHLPEGAGKIPVHFDNATKLLSFSEPNQSVGAVTYGLAAIGMRTAHSFLPEFEAELPADRLATEQFAERLRDFFAAQWKSAMPANYTGPNMTFVVGGFDDGQPYGRVFEFGIPGVPAIVEHQAGKDPGGQEMFGLTWGGQRDFVDRILRGYDHRLPELVAKALGLKKQGLAQLEQALQPLQMPMPIQAMALQDCVNAALFFVGTTIAAQELTMGLRGCGGPIDVAVITRREGLRFVQRKAIRGT